jgi:hypothetical protein
VTVGGEIHTVPGSAVDDVRDEALKRLKSYFGPFPGEGPEGYGWPFGRAVHISEIYEELENVEGVDFVREVRFLHLATSEKVLHLDRSAIGVQIGIHSTVGVDSRLGCLTAADTERLITDTSGRLMAVRLLPHELVKMDYSGLEIRKGAL